MHGLRQYLYRPGSLIAIALLILTFPSLAQEGDSAPKSETQRTIRLDFRVPVQTQFRDWPPDELRKRPYWQPWGRAAFQRAHLVGRPVLFVMANEWSHPARTMLNGTLSAPEVLQQANENYVSVLVNSDRRPDIRERYQTGGWPVVAFLLPNGLPILSPANEAGTLQPITTTVVDTETMEFLLVEGDKYWEKVPQQLYEQAIPWLRDEGPNEPEAGDIDEPATDSAARWLVGNADRVAGGFGAAPKFVVPGLVEYAGVRRARGRPELEEHALFTLGQIVVGPLFDRRDGGVHRMASQPQWAGIQYEKMLAGNTALIRELTFALRQQPESQLLRDTLRQTADFVVQTLGRPGGGFFLAQSADIQSDDGGGYWTSGDEGVAPPAIDPHVLTGPNALAGAALIRAGMILEDPATVAAGRDAIELVLDRAYRKGRGVLHIIEPGPTEHFLLVAQADAAFGLIDAYESLGDSRYLDAARDIVETAWANLKRPDESLLRDHLPVGPSIGLLARPRRPIAPNVQLARAMIRLDLHRIAGPHRERAGILLEAISGDLERYGVQATRMALAIEEYIREPLRIEIPQGEDPAAQSLRRGAVNSAWPWTLVSYDTTASTGAPARLSFRDHKSIAEGPAALKAAIHTVTSAETP